MQTNYYSEVPAHWMRALRCSSLAPLTSLNKVGWGQPRLPEDVSVCVCFKLCAPIAGSGLQPKHLCLCLKVSGPTPFLVLEGQGLCSICREAPLPPPLPRLLPGTRKPSRGSSLLAALVEGSDFALPQGVASGIRDCACLQTLPPG